MEFEVEYELLFDEAIKSRGGLGLLDVKRLNEEESVFFSELLSLARNFIETCQKDAHIRSTNPMPYVYCGIIDDLEFQATAFVYKGKEFIGISSGAILTLHDLFHRILANKSNFRDIGDPSNEIDYQPLPYITTRFAEIQSHFDVYQYTPFVYAVDPQRQIHASQLAYLTWMFLVSHELAHLRYGHVHYLKNLNGQSFMMEYDSDIAKRIDPSINKVLEWEADSWSATQSIGYIFENIKNPGVFPYLPTYFEIGRPTTAYKNWAFSLWILFRFMDAVRKRKGLAQSLFYPSPSFRFFNAFFVGEYFLLIKGGTSESSKIRLGLVEALNEAEKALCSVSNLTFDLSGFFELYDDYDEQGRFNAIKEYHEIYNDKVRDSLEPFSRSTDLKPKLKKDW